MAVDMVLDIINESMSHWYRVGESQVSKTEIADIPNSTTLESLDMDSLDIVEMLVEIEQDLKINFNERDYSNFKTVGDLREITRKRYETDNARKGTQHGS